MLWRKIMHYGFGCVFILTLIYVIHSHGQEMQMIHDVLRMW
jgi:hypothetical protein